MGRFQRFEDIEAWQLARTLTRDIYQVTNVGTFQRDFGLRDQLRRASVSVMANIAEGFERGGDREFRQFLAIAKGSIGEVRSHLYVAFDAGHISQQQLDRMHALSTDVTNLLGGLMRYLKDSQFKGTKHRQNMDDESNINP
jgi:four helix bundle protein